MKVLAFNGSPKKKGNTFTALEKACLSLNTEGIETEILQVGSEITQGCIACRYCSRKKNMQCVFKEDKLNSYIEKMKEADGFLLGAPIYYSDINGQMKSFLDRAFYVAAANDRLFRYKVGAGILSVRRAGAANGFDTLNKYFSISEMFIATSTYWNMVYGHNPGECIQDEEGIQTVETLGKNMAYLIKALSLAKEEIGEPEPDAKVLYNYIR